MQVRHITRRLRWLWRRYSSSLTMVIVTVCTALFVVLTVLDLLGVVSWQRSLSLLGLSYAGVVQRLWLFQFLTAPLLHANLLHLVFNMLTLWMLGPDVETVLGCRRYAVFSALCAGCAMAGFLLCTPNNPTIGLGYSGVIFGILVAQATFFPNRVLYLYAFFPLKMKHAVLLLAAVALYLSVTQHRNGMAYSAHLFGAVGAWGYLRAERWLATQSRSRGRFSKHRHPQRSPAAAAACGVPSPPLSKAQRAVQHALAFARHASTLPQAIAAMEQALTLDPTLRPTYAKLLHQWKRGIVL